MTNEEEKEVLVLLDTYSFVYIQSTYYQRFLCHHSTKFNFDLKNFVQLSRGINALYQSAKTLVSKENANWKFSVGDNKNYYHADMKTEHFFLWTIDKIYIK